MRCPDYCGVTCVNGQCPQALAYDYSEYGYEYCTCEECAYYKGCEDCCFVDENGNCTLSENNSNTAV